MKQSLALILFSLLIQFTCTAIFAEKKVYKWKAGDGSTQYGDQVPPGVSKNSYDIYNRKGDRVKTISRAKTREEFRIEDERLKKIQILKQLATRKRKEDQRLLRLYPNEESVTLARDERINAIENGISLSTDALKLYQGNIASLRKRAAEHARAGKPIPLRIKRRIAKYRKMIQEIERNIQKAKIKQQKIRLNYEKILSRYHEIK